jgi:hypothetical protein
LRPSHATAASSSASVISARDLPPVALRRGGGVWYWRGRRRHRRRRARRRGRRSRISSAWPSASLRWRCGPSPDEAMRLAAHLQVLLRPGHAPALVAKLRHFARRCPSVREAVPTVRPRPPARVEQEAAGFFPSTFSFRSCPQPAPVNKRGEKLCFSPELKS